MGSDSVPVANILYIMNVTYDSDGKYIESVTIPRPDVESAGYPDKSSKTKAISRAELLSYMDNGYRAIALPSPDESKLGVMESVLMKFVHPEDGNTYIITQAAFKGRDKIELNFSRE